MEQIKLKYLCSSYSTPITQDQIRENGAYEVFGASGIAGYTDTFGCQSDYLGIVKDGAGVGRIAKYKKGSSLLGTMAYIIPTEKADISWLKYAVMSLNLSESVSKTTIPHIYFSDYGNRKVGYCSIAEQHRIAAFLDRKCAEIDRAVAETEKTIEEYKALRQSVITEAVTKGVRGDRPMKDSGVEWIGEIPEEWEIRPLKAYINILPGYAFSSDDFSTEGIPLLRGVNVTPEGIRWEDVVFWNKSVDDNLNQFLLKERDLVVGLDRPWISAGTRVTFIKKNDLPALLLQRVCRIRTSSLMDIRFVYHAIASKTFEEALSTDTTGVSVPHISTQQIQNYRIAIPSVEEQIEICDYLDTCCAEIDRLIAAKQQLLTELESYKKSVIYEYVTGKKEVPTE